MPNAIATSHLTKKFGARIGIEDVGLAVAQGSIYGLLGPNGAGKSTTMSLILGLLKPDSGGVELFGEPWRRDQLRRIGATLNGPALYQHLGAAENLEVHARLLSLAPQAVQRALDEVGLAATDNRPVGQFSTGMKSRLALALALLTDPEILLLDEPQNGLDPEGIHALRRQLKNYAQSGRTILISSHQLGEIEQIVDTVGVLAQGRLRYQGPLTELASSYARLEDAYFELVRSAA